MGCSASDSHHALAAFGFVDVNNVLVPLWCRCLSSGFKLWLTAVVLSLDFVGVVSTSTCVLPEGTVTVQYTFCQSPCRRWVILRGFGLCLAFLLAYLQVPVPGAGAFSLTPYFSPWVRRVIFSASLPPMIMVVVDSRCTSTVRCLPATCLSTHLLNRLHSPALEVSLRSVPLLLNLKRGC